MSYIVPVKIKVKISQNFAAISEYTNFNKTQIKVCHQNDLLIYPGKHDNDRRLADHFGGKLHLGFIKIREKLEEQEVSALSKFNYS